MSDKKARTAEEATERLRTQYGDAVTAVRVGLTDDGEGGMLPRGLANAIILLEDLAAVDLWLREEAIRIATEPAEGRRYCRDFETDTFGNTTARWTWRGKTAVIDLDDFEEIVKEALHCVIKDFRNGEQSVFNTGSWREDVPDGRRAQLTLITIRSVDEDGVPVVYGDRPDSYTVEQIDGDGKIHIPKEGRSAVKTVATREALKSGPEAPSRSSKR